MCVCAFDVCVCVQQPRKTWLADRYGGGIWSCHLRGELPCPRGPCSAGLSFGSWWAVRCGPICKEVIALWREPQRPARTIRNMCFWVTGAWLQGLVMLFYFLTVEAEEVALLWILSDLWCDISALENTVHAALFELVYTCNNAIDFPGFYFILYILISLSPTRQSLNLCCKHKRWQHKCVSSNPSYEGAKPNVNMAIISHMHSTVHCVPMWVIFPQK